MSAIIKAIVTKFTPSPRDEPMEYYVQFDVKVSNGEVFDISTTVTADTEGLTKTEIADFGWSQVRDQALVKAEEIEGYDDDVVGHIVEDNRPEEPEEPTYPAWELGAEYDADDIVTHNGDNWQANKDKPSGEPSESNKDWNLYEG